MARISDLIIFGFDGDGITGVVKASNFKLIAGDGNFHIILDIYGISPQVVAITIYPNEGDGIYDNIFSS